MSTHVCLLHTNRTHKAKYTGSQNFQNTIFCIFRFSSSISILCKKNWPKKVLHIIFWDQSMYISNVYRIVSRCIIVLNLSFLVMWYLFNWLDVSNSQCFWFYSVLYLYFSLWKILSCWRFWVKVPLVKWLCVGRRKIINFMPLKSWRNPWLLHV